MDYFAYVLRNGVGRSYIGVSSDPVRRLAQHNAGESTWTARHRPWALEWSSRALSLSAARRQAAAALERVHLAGLVHRDVHLGNLGWGGEAGSLLLARLA